MPLHNNENLRETVDRAIDMLKPGNAGNVEKAIELLSTLIKDNPTEVARAKPFLILQLNSTSANHHQGIIRLLSQLNLTDGETIRVQKMVKDSGLEDSAEQLNGSRLPTQVKDKDMEKSSTTNCSKQNERVRKMITQKNIEIAKGSRFLENKPRDKRMVLHHTGYQFSANYSSTNHNFIMQNLPARIKRENPYYAAVCIMKNILMRGCPTYLSQYLQEKLGVNDKNELIETSIPLIVPHALKNEADAHIPVWLKTIRGYSSKNDYPAEDFFENCLIEYLGEYKFIPQLMLPEAAISDITQDDNDAFSEERVDFYLPQAHMVIEIDGVQHKTDKLTALQDKERDRYLAKHGIKTVRIASQDIKNRTKKLKSKMKTVKDRIYEYKSIFDEYKTVYEHGYHKLGKQDSRVSKAIRATAVIRFQLLILELLSRGKIRLDDKVWKLNILERDIGDFSELALQDLFLWFKHLTKLLKFPFHAPRLEIKRFQGDYCEDIKGFINIDFSILMRWTDEGTIEEDKERIYLRTDYFDSNNYFKVSTDKLINYQLIHDGKDSDEEALVFFLKNLFGFDFFQSGQMATIKNALQGNDTVGLLPTGAGKSLIYQYVGLLQPCLHFVVTPIKSLMKDQRDNLDKKLIANSNYINSNQNADEKEKVQVEFGAGKYQFVWISPERFQTVKFRNQLEQIASDTVIGYAVIDEVHCLSEWGHDFRTSYLNLAKTIRRFCEKSKVLGLTATASEFVLKDIMTEFSIAKENVITLPSFTRPELNFKIIVDEGKAKYSKVQNIKKLISKINKENTEMLSDRGVGCGIVFTIFVNNGDLGCFKLSQTLQNTIGEEVRWYAGQRPKYSKLKDDEFQEYKDSLQDDFQNDDFKWLVATKAFGMGIDKSNIRYTVHFGIPGSLEALYQEAGRAGRDRQEATCYVVLSKEDFGERYLEEVFNESISVAEIKEIMEEVKYEGRDVFNNLLLWSSSAEDIENETERIQKIFDICAEPNSEKLVEAEKLKLTKQKLEKAIYKMSLMGVVSDWTIENWNAKRAKLQVRFQDYDEQWMKNHLIRYINKYDKEFDQDALNSLLSDLLKNTQKNGSMVNGLIRALLTWQDKEIFYKRRESIKTVYDQCIKNQDDPDALKEYIEAYFRFDDSTFVFSAIAENPKDYRHWFVALSTLKSETLKVHELQKMKASLRRYLESYQNNIGLNMINGLISLMADDFDDKNEIQRFSKSIQAVKEYSEDDQQKILDLTLDTGKVLKEKNKEQLSRILVNEFPEKAYIIHDELKDNLSLDYYLKRTTEKLRETRGLYNV